MASWSAVQVPSTSKTQAPVLPEPGLLLFEARQGKRRRLGLAFFLPSPGCVKPRHPAHVIETMRESMQKTRRIRRGWLDRLRGYDRLYETELTDGQHTAYGRGPTSEASQKSAPRNWEAKFGQEPES